MLIVYDSNEIIYLLEETGVQKSGENQKVFLPIKIRKLNL